MRYSEELQRTRLEHFNKHNLNIEYTGKGGCESQLTYLEFKVESSDVYFQIWFGQNISIQNCLDLKTEVKLNEIVLELEEVVKNIKRS